jgi:hypothetical protein
MAYRAKSRRRTAGARKRSSSRSSYGRRTVKRQSRRVSARRVAPRRRSAGRSSQRVTLVIRHEGAMGAETGPLGGITARPVAIKKAMF